jgi:hypothetical protein
MATILAENARISATMLKRRKALSAMKTGPEGREGRNGLRVSAGGDIL